MPRLDRKPSHRSIKREPSPVVKQEQSHDEDSNSGSTIDVAPKLASVDSSPRDSPSGLAAHPKTPRSPSMTTPLADVQNHDLDGHMELSDSNDRVSPKPEPLPPNKTSRASKKQVARIAPLFDHFPDATDEANSTYQVIDSCIYQNKFLGYTEHAMECDCTEEWDPVTKANAACGEDSDCINRATKMECVGDCACGPACQNQRFWRHLYADVSVIKTEKKGYGLRANTRLKHGDFIFEYIGEVIPEGTFRKRMRQYDDEGIKHFYFMSLSKGEFVDATKRGNLGRFCNHSCNPNCYVDKWVVGDKLRMGLFAEKNIQPGEELVFNYNVDRYGAEPQPCYCGESNCTGFIGGKTQTERATKLSAATIAALGIDDEDWDAWDTVTAKKPKKKKTAEEDDEDYVERAEVRGLDVDGVTKVMAALMQCKEKWIAVKLLERMQKCQDEDVLHRIIKLHGYKILNSQLSAWREDDNVILQILDILDKFPRLTRNKIVDAKIDQTLEPLRESSDERVAEKSSLLLDQWSRLELAYRIPRKVRTTNDSVAPTPTKYERRESQQQRRRSRSRSRSKSPPKGPSTASIPTGPKGQGTGPKAFSFGRAPSAHLHRGKPPLPAGWSETIDRNTGRTYFYSATGETSWTRPSKPAVPPPPPKQASQQDLLKSIINEIVTSKPASKDAKTSTPDTPEPELKKEKKEEKWRSLDEEKQKKLYENTLFPHISHVMNKYKHKIPKDDLKRFAKEIAKKLVSSDYKAGRVDDPTRINEKQQKKVKAFCKEYFDKAATKHKRHEEERAARKSQKIPTVNFASATTLVHSPAPADHMPKRDVESEDEDVKMSDVEDHVNESPATTVLLKRKRISDEDVELKEEDELTKSPVKKANVDPDSQLATPPPPPPPPPPPGPPTDTPPETNTPDAHEVMDAEPDIRADTNFRGKSMADVLAQAQEEGDDEVDWGVDDTEAQRNGMKLQNTMVNEQPVS